VLLFDIKVREEKNIFTTAYPCRLSIPNSGVPRNFIREGGGVSTNSVEDRENGDLGQ